MLKKIMKQYSQHQCSHQWEHVESLTMTKDTITYEQVTVEKVRCSKCELVDYISPHEWLRIRKLQDIPRLRSARHDKANVGGKTA